MPCLDFSCHCFENQRQCQIRRTVIVVKHCPGTSAEQGGTGVSFALLTVCLRLRKGGSRVNRYEAIIEFSRLILDHVRIDCCERNRANATEQMKMLSILLAEQIKLDK